MRHSEQGKATCNQRDDNDLPNQDEAAPACNKDAVEQDAHKDEEASAGQGKLILDATDVEQTIRFPTDLSLLNESREISEHIIDVLRSLHGRKYTQTGIMIKYHF